MNRLGLACWSAQLRLEQLESRINPAIPALNSFPSASASLYLEFGGSVTPEFLGFSNIITPPAGLSASMIEEIWARVAEDFAPFNLNVTTVSPGSFQNQQALRIAIGGDGAWYGGAAGVAAVGSFYNSAPNVAFVFSDLLGGSARRIADTISHEVGHSFGLEHQSRWVGNQLADEYFLPASGHWGPLMGRTSNRQLSIWHNGTTNQGPSITQDEIAVIGGPLNGFGLRPDDFGDTPIDAFPLLAMGSSLQIQGIINTATDVDFFRFETLGGPITIQVRVADFGPNLDAVLELTSIDGTVLNSSAPEDDLNALITGNLTAGSYRVAVKGTGQYGVVGTYRLKIDGPGLMLPGSPPVVPPPGGPRVVAQSPTNLINPGVSVIDFVFNEEMDTESFSLADISSFIGPTGNLLSQITGSQWLNAQTLRISFTSQMVAGAYSMTIGPNILRMSGQPMDQDQDGVAGEPIQDQYIGGFTIVGSMTIPPDAFEVNNSPSQASDLGSLGQLVIPHLTIHEPNDDDYFRFIASDNRIRITLVTGDLLTLSLLDASHNVIASTTSNGPETDLISAVIPGLTYFIRISGAGLTSDHYALVITVGREGNPLIPLPPPPPPPPVPPASLPPEKILSITDGGDGIRYLLSGGAATLISTPIKVFNSQAPIRSSVGDVNGDGVADIVYVTGPGGGAFVRIIDGVTGQDLLIGGAVNVFPGEDLTSIGIFVTVGDFDGDNRDEIVISPDQGGGARVQIFSLLGGRLIQRANFFGIEDPNFRGGARLAAGDVNGDGRVDLIVGAGIGGGPRVAIYDGMALLDGNTLPRKLMADFFAFELTLRDGVYVAAGDINGDGQDDVVFGGGPGGAPRVMALDGARLLSQGIQVALTNPLANFFAFDTATRGGVRVAVKDIDSDNQGDLVAATGAGQPGKVRIYRGSTIVASGSPDILSELAPFGSSILADGIFVG